MTAKGMSLPKKVNAKMFLHKSFEGEKGPYEEEEKAKQATLSKTI